VAKKERTPEAGATLGGTTYLSLTFLCDVKSVRRLMKTAPATTASVPNDAVQQAPHVAALDDVVRRLFVEAGLALDADGLQFIRSSCAPIYGSARQAELNVLVALTDAERLLRKAAKTPVDYERDPDDDIKLDAIYDVLEAIVDRADGVEFIKSECGYASADELGPERRAWRLGPQRGVRGRIAGRRMADMRAVLRRDRGPGLTFDDARQVVVRDTEYDSLRTILDDLVAEGLLVQDADRWRRMEHGRALCSTSRRRLSRARGEQLLRELVSRAPVINADDRYAYRIAAIVAFGSVLSDKPMIGDVDVAVWLTDRFEDRAAREAVHDVARTRCGDTSFLADESWAHTEVMRALRGRSTALEAHDVRALISILSANPRAPYRVVFGSWRPDTAR
jgi:hypothetical protein